MSHRGSGEFLSSFGQLEMSPTRISVQWSQPEDNLFLAVRRKMKADVSVRGCRPNLHLVLAIETPEEERSGLIRGPFQPRVPSFMDQFLQCFVSRLRAEIVPQQATSFKPGVGVGQIPEGQGLLRVNSQVSQQNLLSMVI